MVNLTAVPQIEVGTVLLMARADRPVACSVSHRILETLGATSDLSSCKCFHVCNPSGLELEV